MPSASWSNMHVYSKEGRGMWEYFCVSSVPFLLKANRKRAFVHFNTN